MNIDKINEIEAQMNNQKAGEIKKEGVGDYIGKPINDIKEDYSWFSWRRLSFKSAYTFAGFGVGVAIVAPIAPVAMFGAASVVMLPCLAGLVTGVIGLGIGRKVQEEAEFKSRTNSYYSVYGRTKLETDLNNWESILNYGDLRKAKERMAVVGQKMKSKYRGMPIEDFAALSAMGVAGIGAGVLLTGAGIGGVLMGVVGVAGVGLIGGGLLKAIVALATSMGENLSETFFSNEKSQRKAIEKYRNLLPEISGIQIQRFENKVVKPIGSKIVEAAVEKSEAYDLKKLSYEITQVVVALWEGSGERKYKELQNKIGNDPEKIIELDKTLIMEGLRSLSCGKDPMIKPNKIEEVIATVWEKVQKAEIGEAKGLENEDEELAFKILSIDRKKFVNCFPKNMDEIEEKILKATEVVKEEQRLESERQAKILLESKRDYLEIFLIEKNDVIQKAVSDLLGERPKNGRDIAASKALLEEIKIEIKKARDKEENYEKKEKFLEKLEKSIVLVELIRAERQSFDDKELPAKILRRVDDN